jgi:hypothetical protein
MGDVDPVELRLLGELLLGHLPLLAEPPNLRPHPFH